MALLQVAIRREVAVNPTLVFVPWLWLFSVFWDSSGVSEALLGHSPGLQDCFCDCGKRVKSRHRLSSWLTLMEHDVRSVSSFFHSHFDFYRVFTLFPPPRYQCSIPSLKESGKCNRFLSTSRILLIMGYNTGPLHLVLIDEALDNSYNLAYVVCTVSLQICKLRRGFRMIIWVCLIFIITPFPQFESV